MAAVFGFGCACLIASWSMVRYSAMRSRNWPNEALMVGCWGGAFIVVAAGMAVMSATESLLVDGVGVVLFLTAVLLFVGGLIANFWVPPGIRRRFGPWRP